MPAKVLLVGDPSLRRVCSPTDAATATSILDEMHLTMLAENGMGLAANQIGYSVRVFILKEEGGYSEYINPIVISQEELVPFEGEGCLSIPGVSVTTKRYRKLKLQWTTKDGTNRESDFEDMRAFAVQHEMDHLNGKLYVDQFGPLKRQMVMDKHKKFLRHSK